MDIHTLTRFLIWCTIINGALLLFWSLMLMLAPDLVYRTQTRFFPLSKEAFTIIMYSFLGLFKIFYISLNVVPMVALLIVG